MVINTPPLEPIILYTHDPKNNHPERIFAYLLFGIFIFH